MFFAKKVTAQDTVVTIDKSIENIIRYNAKDSIFTDLKSRKIHLYGQATVEMEDTKMSAGYILVDLNSSEITASYRYDKDSNKVEFPTFSDGTELINCERMRFNTKTKKGLLEELA
ncbi:MAG: hypothetical protein ACOVNZ_02750, partial [Crocinitomicaceae bacterium]